jgi:ribosomal protein S18 acetylase RimI-like enzyme
LAVITKSISSSETTDHLRLFDPRRDLESVADLVELCFAGTLDPDGRRYLERMRSTARNSSIFNWVSTMAEWTSVTFTGYVWQQDGRIVGNASLIPYFIQGKRYFLIANVAVHPDYRRQGIARQLTERSVNHARQKGSPSAWLHVREENDGAVNLYRSLGFVERARRTTWFSKSDLPLAELPLGTRIGVLRSRYWDLQRGWLQQSYPPELSWHMPIKIGALNPGLPGYLSRFFYNIYLVQWAVFDMERIIAVVSWQPTAAHANLLWLAAPADSDDRAIQALLVHARQHAPSQRSLMIDYPARQHSQAIQSAGFYEHQTLIWMELPFRQNT